MKIVLNTNVLVSGLLSPYGPPGQIVRMLAAGELTLCHDARIICEYHDVLARPKFPFSPEHVEALLDQIRAAGEPVSTRPLAKRLPDGDDEPFLEVAIAGDAEHLVTGNPRHYPARCRGGVRVVSPRRFLDCLRADA